MMKTRNERKKKMRRLQDDDSYFAQVNSDCDVISTF